MEAGTTIQKVFVNVAGTWKQTTVYVSVGGTWRLV